MAKLLAIVRQDLRVFLADRSNLPSLLIMPVVMTVLIALVNGGAFSSPPVQRLDVIDQDETQASSQFLASVRLANPALTLCPMDNTQEDICDLSKSPSLAESQSMDRVASATALALLEIPAGFGASLASLQPVTLTFHGSSSFGESQPAQQAVQAALTQVNAAAVASRVGLSVIDDLQNQPLSGDQAQQMKAALYQRALAIEKNKAVKVELALSGSTQAPTMGDRLQYGLGQSVPGMGAMFVLMTLFSGMSALIVERQQWTLQRLAVMPVSRSTLLGGKILARFCLGLIQFGIVFMVGALLGMNFGKDPFALLLLVIAYTLAVTAITFAVGSGLKSPFQAVALGLLLTLTMAPLGGAWWPMDITPRFMQIVGHVSPVAWAMDGFTALTYRGAHLANVLVPLAVLLGMAVVAFIIAIPRFRYHVD
jgi:ABC-type multidrug transport system permease subunit